MEVRDEKWGLERMTVCERNDAHTEEWIEVEGRQWVGAACGWESWICGGA